MVQAEELSNIIQYMLVDCPEREIAENSYNEIAKNSPFTLIEYHFSYLQTNIQDQKSVIRSLTLLKILFQSFEHFQLSADQHQFIKIKLIEVFSYTSLNEQARTLLIFLIQLVENAYNRDMVVNQGNPRWISIFSVCLEYSNSDDELLAYSSIKLLALFIKFGSFPTEPHIENLHAIIQKYFSLQEFRLPIISTVELVLAIYTDIQNVIQYAPFIINLLPMIPPNRAKSFVCAMFDFKNIGFFFEVIPQLVEVLSTAIANDQYSVDARVTIMEILSLIISKEQILAKYDYTVFMPIVQALSIVFTSIETDENHYLSKSSRSLLTEMTIRINLTDFDDSCLQLASQLLSQAEWQSRYSGLSIICSLCGQLENTTLQQISQNLVTFIQDVVPCNRKVVYVIMKSIAKHKKALFTDHLSPFLFPLLLESITKETDVDNGVYAIKVLSHFCNYDSDMLAPFADSILALCFRYASQDIELLQVSILICIGSLCYSCGTNVHQYLSNITEYLAHTATIDLPSIRFQTIMTILDSLEICVNNDEKIAFCNTGVQLFMKVDWTTIEERKLLDLFRAFKEFTCILGVANVPSFGEIITELIKMSSQQVSLEVAYDVDLDYSTLPSNIRVLRYEGRAILVNINEIIDIFTSMDILGEFIQSFPAFFVGNTDAIFESITKQFGSQLNLNMKVVSSALKLFKVLIEKADVLNLNPDIFQDILKQFIENNFYDHYSVELIINIIQFFIMKFPDQQIIMNMFTLCKEILGKSFIRQDELGEQMAALSNQTDREYEIDKSKDRIGNEFDNEKAITMGVTNFFLFLVNTFPQIVSEQFLHTLYSLYAEKKPSRFNPPRILIMTLIESLTNKNYEQYLDDLVRYINDDYPEECEFIMKIVNIIVKDSTDPNILGKCLELIKMLLSLDQIEDEKLDRACNLGLFNLVCILKKVPGILTPEILQKFLQLLPATDFNSKLGDDINNQIILIHEYFADEVQSKQLYMSAEILPQIFTIIAKICNSNFINETTTAKFKQIVTAIFQNDENVLKAIYEQIGAKFFNRLTEFIRPNA